MKTQPWFIRFSSVEEAALVDEWLEENFGSTLNLYSNNIIGVTNTDNDGNASNDYLYWVDESALTKTKRHEIKLNFKTIIDSVEWPSFRSEKDLKIEELEKTIAEAQKKLQELKEM
jgi:hypothetical protein